MHHKFLFAISCALMGTTAAFADCPPNSHAYLTTSQGNITTTHCECDTGFTFDGTTCNQVPATSSSTRAPVQLSSPEVAELAHRIDAISVPPPIPTEEATINFGELPETDKTTGRVLFGADAGVAVLELSGTLAGATLYGKILLATGRTIIAAEAAADVYLVRQEALYQNALGFLKDKRTQTAFTAIVRDLKTGHPIGANANVQLVRAARAIIDPKLGNGATRSVWDALLSPRAKNAMLTQICVELSAEATGQAAGQVIKRINAAREPAYREAIAWLPQARSALNRATNPSDRLVLGRAILEANWIIAHAYEASGHNAIAALESIYSGRELEEMAHDKYRAQAVQQNLR